jgi:endonuclease G
MGGSGALVGTPGNFLLHARVMWPSLLRILVFMLLSGLPVTLVAQPRSCAVLFVGGQAPALLNPKLAQRTTPLCNDAYAALASGVTRGPLWAAERLTPESLEGARATPRQGEFHAESWLPEDDQAQLQDYSRSGYDRGHMAPSGDMPNVQAQQQSFSLANVVPQTGVLNRGLWEGIESAVRRLAEQQGDLYVVTGPAFSGTRLRSLQGRVLVPTATWKAVYDPVAHGAGVYVCRNTRRPTCATVSVAEMVRAVGIDPFPALPTSVKTVAMTLPKPEPSRYARGAGRAQHERGQSGQTLQ